MPTVRASTEAQERARDVLEGGGTYRAAAAAAGVGSTRTIATWIAKYGWVQGSAAPAEVQDKLDRQKDAAAAGGRAAAAKWREKREEIADAFGDIASQGMKVSQAFLVLSLQAARDSEGLNQTKRAVELSTAARNAATVAAIAVDKAQVMVGDADVYGGNQPVRTEKLAAAIEAAQRLRSRLRLVEGGAAG